MSKLKVDKDYLVMYCEKCGAGIMMNSLIFDEYNRANTGRRYCITANDSGLVKYCINCGNRFENVNDKGEIENG